jgi:ethanolamine utilization protein EutP
MAEEKKPRKIILMGRSRVGKTTLLQAMHNEVIEYKKTQEIIVHDDAIDTPGEYIDQSGLWRACIVAACDADIVVLVHDAGNTMGRLPQMFSMTFAKPTIGVVTKIDGKTEEDIEIAENFLRMSGASKIVRTSSFDHEGIQELIDLIENLDLTDY